MLGLLGVLDAVGVTAAGDRRRLVVCRDHRLGVAGDGIPQAARYRPHPRAGRRAWTARLSSGMVGRRASVVGAAAVHRRLAAGPALALAAAIPRSLTATRPRAGPCRTPPGASPVQPPATMSRRRSRRVDGHRRRVRAGAVMICPPHLHESPALRRRRRQHGRGRACAPAVRRSASGRPRGGRRGGDRGRTGDALRPAPGRSIRADHLQQPAPCLSGTDPLTGFRVQQPLEDRRQPGSLLRGVRRRLEQCAERLLGCGRAGGDRPSTAACPSRREPEPRAVSGPAGPPTQGAPALPIIIVVAWAGAGRFDRPTEGGLR